MGAKSKKAHRADKGRLIGEIGDVMIGRIERKEEAPKAIYLQWKDDDGEVLGETTWCFERIYPHDIRYIIDKRHLSKSSGGDIPCTCPKHNCKLTPIEICEQCVKVVSRYSRSSSEG